MVRFLRRSLLLALALSPACTDDLPWDTVLDASTVATNSDGGTEIAPALALPAHCVVTPGTPPPTLECTGLYSDMLAKQESPAVRRFTPGRHLWSDGADKQRWIFLPQGSVIDNTRPTEWSFPVGTRTWKEFKRGGQRIETRFFQKLSSDQWLMATYLWKNGETTAELFEGGDIQIADGTYHVPLHDECGQCHRGRKDLLLGFEGVLLGLPSAEGVTLATLVAEGKLSVPPARTSVRIPDDGTGRAEEALSWLHVNCGVSCHNDNVNAVAYSSRMYLRIDPSKLDEPTPAAWNSIKTTVNQQVRTANFTGVRIVPGDPDGSLLMQLATTRGSNRAMPPIATRTLDDDNLVIIRDWILRLGGTDAGSDAGAPPDAGTPDTGTPPIEAGVADAGLPDAEDAEVADAGAADAEVPDAGSVDTVDAASTDLPDAEVPDAGTPAPIDIDASIPDPDAGAPTEIDAGDLDASDAEAADVEAPDADTLDSEAPEAAL